MEQMFMQTVVEIVAENIAGWIFSAVAILIGAFGAWVLKKIGKREGLKGISTATDEVIKMAIITVGELQQTIVDDLKANKRKINLITDQSVHVCQIIITFIIYNIVYKGGIL